MRLERAKQITQNKLLVKSQEGLPMSGFVVPEQKIQPLVNAEMPLQLTKFGEMVNWLRRGRIQEAIDTVTENEGKRRTQEYQQRELVNSWTS
jgi:hypothetical protein